MGNIRVGVAAILKNSKGEILMVKRKNPPAKGLWGFPGGGIEFGETIKEAAKREVKEETGLNADIGKILTFGEAIEKDKDIHRIVAICEAKMKSGVLEPSDDALDIMWIGIDKISKMEKKISPYTISNLKNLGYMR